LPNHPRQTFGRAGRFPGFCPPPRCPTPPRPYTNVPSLLFFKHGDQNGRLFFGRGSLGPGLHSVSVPCFFFGSSHRGYRDFLFLFHISIPFFVFTMGPLVKITFFQVRSSVFIFRSLALLPSSALPRVFFVSVRFNFCAGWVPPTSLHD